MDITFKVEGERAARKCVLPFPESPLVDVAGECPHCQNIPFKARGDGNITRGHDTYEARALCCNCGVYVGQIVAKVSTIFGIEEDDRVLNGSRCRVY